MEELFIKKVTFIHYDNRASSRATDLINNQKSIISNILKVLGINKKDSSQYEEKYLATDDTMNFYEWGKTLLEYIRIFQNDQLWIDISCLTKLHTFMLLKILKEASSPIRIFYTTPQYYGKKPSTGVSEPLIQLPFTRRSATRGMRWAVIVIPGKEEVRCFRIVQEFNPELIFIVWPKPGDFHSSETNKEQIKYRDRYMRLFSLSHLEEDFIDFSNLEVAKNKIQGYLEEIYSKEIFNCAITNLGPRSGSVALAILSYKLNIEDWQKSCVRYAYVKPGFYNWAEYSKGIDQVWDVVL